MNWVTSKVKYNLCRNIQKVLNILASDGDLPEALLTFNHTWSHAYFLLSLLDPYHLDCEKINVFIFSIFILEKSGNSWRLDYSSSVTVELMVLWDYLKENISVIIFSSLSGSPCLRNGNEVSPSMDLMVREEAWVQVQWTG